MSDDLDMTGQVQRNGDRNHGEEEEEYRICEFLNQQPLLTSTVANVKVEDREEEQKEKEEKQHSLKMNFSVGVNMYREKVTSY